MINKGIILLAAGHPYYGKMAAALAASIKAVEDFPITLFWHGKALNHLSIEETALFSLEELPDEYVFNSDGSFNPLKARMYFDKLSPYDSTLSIDVDNIWITRQKPADIFDELKDVSFTIQNAGFIDCEERADHRMSVWADINSTIKAYNLTGKRFYKTFGEWIFFKKDKSSSKLFNAARKVFLSKPLVKAKEFIGQVIPDELAFTIAMAQTEIYPHEDNYFPTTYYHLVSLGLHRHMAIHELAKKYVTLSMGGSLPKFPLIEKYNIMASASYKKLQMTSIPYKYKSKRSFLPERLKM